MLNVTTRHPGSLAQTRLHNLETPSHFAETKDSDSTNVEPIQRRLTDIRRQSEHTYWTDISKHSIMRPLTEEETKSVFESEWTLTAALSTSQLNSLTFIELANYIVRH